MSNPVDDLREAVQRLEKAHKTVRERFEQTMPGVNPLEVCTPDGHYVLLESLTEIVRARSVLAEIAQRG